MKQELYNDEQLKVLAWIHSNRAITPKHFRLKFKPEQTPARACQILDRWEKLGLLKRHKAFLNSDSFYSLSYKSIKVLADKGLILLSKNGREAKINTFEKEHDKRVINMRVAIENSGLDNLLWLTDYEMRCGLNSDKKRALVRGTSDPHVFLIEKNKRKVPDGYFEADLEGRTWSFVFEYEHHPYSQERVQTVLLRLYKEYPDSIKTIVVNEPSRLPTLLAKIGALIHEPKERVAWIFSTYEEASNKPFLSVPWVDLDGDPFALLQQP
jgi:hypothetical protein